MRTSVYVHNIFTHKVLFNPAKSAFDPIIIFTPERLALTQLVRRRDSGTGVSSVAAVNGN